MSAQETSDRITLEARFLHLVERNAKLVRRLRDVIECYDKAGPEDMACAIHEARATITENEQ